MPEACVTILGQELRLEGDPQRLRDLASSLEARLGTVAGGGEGVRQLALVALQLMAESQAAGAALARAHFEIDQLNELLVARAPPREAWRIAEKASARRA